MNWQLEPTEQFERDAKRYAKRQSDEFLAVMDNLEKNVVAMETAAHPKLVQFGFLHEEPRGIRAIEQSGGTLANGKKRGKLDQTRFYTYAVMELKVLHLLCLGSKTTQAKDLRYAESAVDVFLKDSGE